MRPRTGNAGDVSHPDIMEVAKVSYGLLLVPIKVIGILFTYGTFADQKSKIEETLELHEEALT